MKIASTDLELIYSEIKSFTLKRKFLKYHENTTDPEIEKIVKFIKKQNKIPLFPYEFKNLKKEKIVIKEEQGLNYILHNSKKLFFSKKYKNKYRCKRYYKNLMLEQTDISPHKYLTEEFCVDNNSIILDLGGAEGIFSLENVDKAESIYIFESNKMWIEALTKTFEKYENVYIIDKFVSDKTEENKISLDDFIREHNLINKKIFIKMDIEGNEEKALKGLKYSLENIKDLKIVACLYHTHNAEENIIKILNNNFEFQISNGYIIYYYDYELREPYLRRGVVRAKKI